MAFFARDGVGLHAAIFFFLLLPLLLLTSLAHAACTIKDDTGQVIHLNHSATRIVSLAPDLTETLFAIGAGKQVIGVISGSDYPAKVRELPVVGFYNGIDLERLIALRPDLIVTWGSSFSRPLSVAKKMGIPVYIAQPKQLEDVLKTMKNLGCLTGQQPQAQLAMQAYSHQLTMLRQQYAHQKPVTVFYQIGAYSLITINKESWIHQALTLCGGRNIFADTFMVAPEVGWEAVVTRNPQVIMSGEEGESWKKRWQHWPEMAAVKHHYLFTLDPDLIHRAGPRLVEGVAEMCKCLQSVR